MPYHIEAARNAILSYIHETGKADFVDGKMIFLQGSPILEEKNGNDLEAVIGILNRAKAETGNGKPIAIILNTEMGFGVDYMMGTHAWHGKAPNDEQLDTAFKQLYLEAPADY